MVDQSQHGRAKYNVPKSQLPELMRDATSFTVIDNQGNIWSSESSGDRVTQMVRGAFPNLQQLEDTTT